MKAATTSSAFSRTATIFKSALHLGNFGKPNAQMLEEYSDGLERLLELSQLRHLHLDLEADSVAMAWHIHSFRSVYGFNSKLPIQRILRACLDVRGERGEPHRWTTVVQPGADHASEM